MPSYFNMRNKGYKGYGSIWDWAEEQLEDVEKTKAEAVDRAGAEARTGATKATEKFWASAAWIGALALVAVVLVKRK